MFKNRKLRKRLQQIGTTIDFQFMVYINNDKPAIFPTQNDAFSYIKNYRDNNTIFKLQIYRIETYSL